MRNLLLYTSLLFLPLISWSQDRCGTVPFNETRFGDTEQTHFEEWMQNKIREKRTLRMGAQKADEVYTIPVVVHIIHKGEAEGMQSNIPLEQIESQIQTLNEDFRRLNADASNTPLEFEPVAADIQIEFELAKRDPEGLPTNGINRVKGSQNTYSISEIETLSSESYWSSDEYFNIWVAALSADYIGYAMLPMSNLNGLEIERNIDPTIDGIFIDYRYFGTGYNADDFSKGRTVTHEAGHWLGLRHIWGDSPSCSQDDYCDDTPEQSGSTDFDLTCDEASMSISCGSVDMVQNYMDYTADACMNLFTQDQRNRMRVVLENSPRRKSLLNSPAKLEPIQVANDLGIFEVVSPLQANCENTFIPEIVVRNYGTNSISDFEVALYIDDVEVEQFNTVTNLDLLETTTVTFSESISNLKSSKYSFIIESVNNTTDGNPENNIKDVFAYFPETETLPQAEDFSNSTTPQNSTYFIDESSSWTYAVAPDADANNEAAVLNYATAPSSDYGNADYLISNSMSMIGIASLDLNFKYAYASNSTSKSDGLEVRISTDCGETFPIENSVFLRWAPNLGTTSVSDASFIPSGAGDWEEVSINLSPFVNAESLTIAFIGYNGNGNNIYLDDILLYSSITNNYDVLIEDVNQVPVVSCIDQFTADIVVRNNGFMDLNSFRLQANIDDQSYDQIFDTGINLIPGETTSISLSFSGISEGEKVLSVTVSEPNGEIDDNPENNYANPRFTINESEEDIPIKIDFLEQAAFSNWEYYSQDAFQFWEIYVDDRDYMNRSLFYNAFTNINLGIENLYVSPVLNLRGLNEASLQFDYSYAYRDGRNDRLQVLLSRNCGRSFDEVLFDQNGIGLAVEETSSEWYPTEESQWKTAKIDLSEYAGRSDIRVAFAFTNQNGNNLFIDNIEFFDLAEPIEIPDLEEKIRTFPNPAEDQFTVKLNLKVKQQARIRLVSLRGEVILDMPVNNALNQEILIRNIEASPGIYILQFLGDTDQISKRIMITR
ncbi:T9SS-dependent choice-of-anchor J family protein [Reichenbachiella ulvae]|uniref:Choice-of-anchor J domain-containing protein n=1 Tax=Reichenbachiella ulvae TaxID=2980104 RepID=A0ABT3CRC3_9BACT|nr:choice-of-anchor J domain-containing protein [Reichenbachiella ulvae]MCV9386238.1 choice-of-anchor J domain-containing protein [Reichenbachiella ulvae]